MTRNRKAQGNTITHEPLALLRWLMILLGASCIFIILLLGNFKSTLYHDAFYAKEFAALGVNDDLGKENAAQKAGEVTGYLRGTGQLSDAFTAREQQHMADVKALVQRFTFAYYALFVLLLLTLYGIYRHERILAEYLTSISYMFLIVGAFACLFAALGYLAMQDFSSAFIRFHQLLFSNDLWLLPSGSLLIRLFPEQFFFDFAYAVAASTLLSCGLLFGLGAGMRIRAWWQRRKVTQRR